MTSAFWGGFAGGVQKQRDIEYAASQEEKKMRLAEELRAQYDGKIVDSSQTTYEGNFEVKRSKLGNEISRRQLTPEEIAARKADQEKNVALADEAKARAGVAVKGLENYDSDRQFEIDDKAAGRRIQQAQLGLTARGLDIQEQRLDREAEDVPIQLLFEADGFGDSSAATLMENYRDRLAMAETKADRKAIIAEYTGTARQLLSKIRQQQELERRKASAGGSVVGALGAPKP